MKMGPKMQMESTLEVNRTIYREKICQMASHLSIGDSNHSPDSPHTPPSTVDSVNKLTVFYKIETHRKTKVKLVLTAKVSEFKI